MKLNSSSFNLFIILFNSKLSVLRIWFSFFNSLISAFNLLQSEHVFTKTSSFKASPKSVVFTGWNDSLHPPVRWFSRISPQLPKSSFLASGLELQSGGFLGSFSSLLLTILLGQHSNLQGSATFFTSFFPLLLCTFISSALKCNSQIFVYVVT